MALRTTLLLPASLVALAACKSDTGVTQLNSPPDAVITSHESGDAVDEDVLVELRGYVSDADHALDSLGVVWRVDDERVCDAAAGTDGFTTCEVELDEGTREVSLEVVDPKGKAAITSIELEVVGTEAPEIELLDPSESGTYYSNELVRFAAQISDAEDDPEDLVVRWESSEAGELDLGAVSPDSSGWFEAFAYLEEAEHAVTIEVEDTSGKISRQSVVIEVGGENTAPRCEILQPGAGEVFEQGSVIDFVATIEDVDDELDTLVSTWSSSIDGEMYTGLPGSTGDFAFSTGGLSVGSHVVTLVSTDARGDTCNETVAVLVGNAPEVSITEPTDGDWIYEDEDADIAVLVSDPEDAAPDLALTWSSDLDGTLSTDAAGSDGTAAIVAALSTGDHTLTVTAVDPIGLSASDSVTLTIQACTPTTWYADTDADSYGDASSTLSQCREPSGYVSDSTDCDDTDSSINPGASETWYDGVDSDCDGASDYDRDGDGYDHDSYGGDDCNDNNKTINPGATETWYDGTDSDCDGASDYDRDGDGYDHDSYGGDDCNDNNKTINPGASETWYDGTDSDCDGLSDYDADVDGYDSDSYSGDDCDDTDSGVNPGASETWYDGTDADCDGASDYDADGDGHDSDAYSGDDCDDAEEDVNPDEAEICDDGLDNDCDGDAEECRLSGDYDMSDADAILVGEAAGDDAGVNVAFAGDVDGDGNDDLLVGARNDDDGGSNAGAAYLVLGPITGTVDLSTAKAKLTGESSNDYAGYRLAGSGDSDNDGHADLLIGAWLEDEGAANAGAAYLVQGPVSGDMSLSAADAKLTGTSLNSRASESLAWAGDVNGDGDDDIIVGEPWGDPNGNNDGVAYLIFGPVSGTIDLANADAVIEGANDGDEAGSSVAGVGDTDGDGVDDVLIGAENEDTGGTDAGAAYLILGPASGTFGLGAADALLNGENADDSAYIVSAAGDTDDDGYDDVMVGAFQEDTGGTSAGAVYLVRGPLSDMDLGSADAIFTGESGGDHAGQELSSPGDIDGDGYSELLIGGRYEDTGGSNAGAAYLWYGPQSGTSSLSGADASFYGDSAGDYAGTLAGAGDANGDGSGDLLFGAENDDTGGSDAGAAYLFYGSGM